mgnify:CR=1 FL=1
MTSAKPTTTDERIQKAALSLVGALEEINKIAKQEAELNSKPRRAYFKFNAHSPNDKVQEPQPGDEALTPEALRKRKAALLKKAERLQAELLTLNNKKNAETAEARQSYKMSAHLLSQTIKIPKPQAPTLFDYLDRLPDSQQKDVIETHGGSYEAYQINGTKPAEIRSIVEGVNVKATERKLIDALCLLLHRTSNNTDETSEQYYTGNKDPELVKYPELVGKQKAPRLSFTLYEIAKAHHGKDAIGGFDLENTHKTLEELSAKSFLIRYERKTYPTAEEAKNRKNKRGQQLQYTKEIVETYEPLVRIIRSSLEEYYEGEATPERTTEILVQLSPVFRDQISSYFVRVPTDFNKRTQIAHNNRPPSKEVLRLLDYCLMHISRKKSSFELNIEKLYDLCSNEPKTGGKRPRWYRIRERAQEAVDTCKRLGIITEIENSRNTAGGEKLIFHLAQDWAAEETPGEYSPINTRA